MAYQTSRWHPSVCRARPVLGCTNLASIARNKARNSFYGGDSLFRRRFWKQLFLWNWFMRCRRKPKWISSKWKVPCFCCSNCQLFGYGKNFAPRIYLFYLPIPVRLILSKVEIHGVCGICQKLCKNQQQSGKKLCYPGLKVFFGLQKEFRDLGLVSEINTL